MDPARRLPDPVVNQESFETVLNFPLRLPAVAGAGNEGGKAVNAAMRSRYAAARLSYTAFMEDKEDL